ncbi:MAG TPA: sensor histidine kinase [Streptosporangiaceae bacterium]|nr:sensor histidine kinase [Streptosporangiaceae bacterium]
MTPAGSGVGCGTASHRALFYDGAEDYASGIVSFLGEGLAAGEPVLVAVPAARIGLIKERVDGLAGPGSQVTFIDMADVGRNPSRVIPAVRRFASAHPGRRTRAVGEILWPGRSPAEVREVIRHEALCDAAFAGLPVTVLCSYDAGSLDDAVLRDAARTHRHIQQRGEVRASEAYGGPDVARAIGEQPLPSPPAGADTLTFQQGGLARLRRYVLHHATQAGLGAGRTQDLVMAVNEAATNTVVHAKAPGTLRIWQERGALVCEVSDPGRITDPLAGRHVPSPRAGKGHGLWMINQICDLVELRSGTWGTMIRMHMNCS